MLYLLLPLVLAQAPPVKGPEQGAVCPVGAIQIAPGTDVQTLVDVNPGGSTFCFLSGLHRWTRTVTPKSGDTFVGEVGAILDWSSAAPRTVDNIEGFFVAHNQDINDVTFRNLTLQHSPARGINGSAAYNCNNVTHTCYYGDTSGADRWTIDHVLIDGCQFYGVSLSNYVVLTNSIIRHCGETQQGGAYGAALLDHGLLENNEFSYYGNETKIHLSRNVTLRGNWYHDSKVNGPWLDGENIDWLMENNLVTDVAGECLFIEISDRGVMRGNIIRRCGDNSILVSTSHNVEVYNNDVEGFRGIHIFLYGPVVDGSPNCGWINSQCYSRNVSVHDNTIRISNIPGVLANGLGYAEMTDSAIAEYMDGSHNLTFANNHYILQNQNAFIWFWGNAPAKNWGMWQAIPQDVTGTISMGGGILTSAPPPIQKGRVF